MTSTPSIARLLTVPQVQPCPSFDGKKNSMISLPPLPDSKNMTDKHSQLLCRGVEMLEPLIVLPNEVNSDTKSMLAMHATSSPPPSYFIGQLFNHNTNKKP